MVGRKVSYISLSGKVYTGIIECIYYGKKVTNAIIIGDNGSPCKFVASLKELNFIS